MQYPNYQLAMILILMLLSSSFQAQDPVIEITDDTFYEYLLRKNIDINKDGLIQKSEALLLKSINIRRADFGNIKFLSEFKNLETIDFFYCKFNSKIELKNLEKLQAIGFVYSTIPAIQFDNLTNLKILNFTDCKLKEVKDLDLENVENILFYKVNLRYLSLKNVPNLKRLECSTVELSNLDVRDCKNLRSLIYNYSTKCDIRFANNSKLIYLNLTGSHLSELNTDSLYNVQELDIVQNEFTDLDLKPLLELRRLLCRDNQLTHLDFSNCKYIQGIFASENKLNSLVLKDLKHLTQLYISNNTFRKMDLREAQELHSLELNYSPLLEEINVLNSHQLEHISIWECPKLKTIRAAKESNDLIKQRAERDEAKHLKILNK